MPQPLSGSSEICIEFLDSINGRGFPEAERLFASQEEHCIMEPVECVNKCIMWKYYTGIDCCLLNKVTRCRQLHFDSLVYN